MQSGYRLPVTIKFDKEGESLQYNTLGSRSQRGDGTSGRSKIEREDKSEKGERESWLEQCGCR